TISDVGSTRKFSGLGSELVHQQPQLALHFVEHELALRRGEADLDLRHRFLALVEQSPTRSRDGEAPLVEQLLDAKQELDLVREVHAVAGAVLLRTQHAELRLPVTEYVRADRDQITDLADRSVELGIGRCFSLQGWQWQPLLSTLRS